MTKNLCRAITEGHTIKMACEASGLSETAFNEWIRRGEEHEKPFSEFAASIARARTRAKAKIVGSILEDKDWRAKAWYLERCYPEEFGRTEERILAKDSRVFPTPILKTIIMRDEQSDLARLIMNESRKLQPDEEKIARWNHTIAELGAARRAEKRVE